MAEEVRVLLWCDLHRFLHSDDVPGTKQTITINGTTFEAEFCPECETELIEPLRDALEQCGRRTGRISRRSVSSDSEANGLFSPTYHKDQVVACPECGKEVKVPSLGSHCRRMHDKSIRQVQEETGIYVVETRNSRVEEPAPTKKVAAARRKR